jgi:hypothetical protein
MAQWRTCEGGSLQSFREQIRGFHDFLRQKLILLRWNSISVASLMIPSIYLQIISVIVT